MGVAASRNRNQVVDAVPDLVEQVLAQLSTALEQHLELRGLGIAHKRRHPVEAISLGGVYSTASRAGRLAG
jgi:hypothetical protein